MSGSSVTLGDIEALNGVLEQRDRLEAVLAFLEKNGAEEELLGAIDEAIEDLEQFLDEKLLSKIPRQPRSAT
ncbi:hypothetical protein [Ollibium composti]|uniref:Uncharacterized protein n=1 Tax=Ollibium composti TaxID=2675109 RepID=A0ABY2Q370_9HYPH|nr:hypothetical protein [Mesorhizobium composti]THF55012.1 hypothetical protein E6C48_19095 [Mesorhizobium composti]